MAEYKVQWRYASSYGGPWQEGEVVELEDKRAEAINRDSPGVLRIFNKDEKDAKDKKKRGQDRMVRTASVPEEPFVMSKDTPGYGAELIRGKEE